MRAIANIRLFQAGTNMEGWLITILRNQFRSEWRWRSKEVEDADGCYAETLEAPAKQHDRSCARDSLRRSFGSLTLSRSGVAVGTTLLAGTVMSCVSDYARRETTKSAAARKRSALSSNKSR